MIAVIKQPCSRPEIADIGSDFMDLRNVVGGGLEHYGFGHGIGILCDIDGRNKGKPFNFRLDEYVDFAGPVLFVGESGENHGRRQRFDSSTPCLRLQSFPST